MTWVGGSLPIGVAFQNVVAAANLFAAAPYGNFGTGFAPPSEHNARDSAAIARRYDSRWARRATVGDAAAHFTPMTRSSARPLFLPEEVMVGDGRIRQRP
ncbi:hypothetical protein KCP69_25810 [Salmonella enterica subsp. enterica]|nr:hypothetical protein KCP69_25810 [Salmonella enterica subsp. enterica]